MYKDERVYFYFTRYCIKRFRYRVFLNDDINILFSIIYTARVVPTVPLSLFLYFFYFFSQSLVFFSRFLPFLFLRPRTGHALRVIVLLASEGSYALALAHILLSLFFSLYFFRIFHTLDRYLQLHRPIN